MKLGWSGMARRWVKVFSGVVLLATCTIACRDDVTPGDEETSGGGAGSSNASGGATSSSDAGGSGVGGSDVGGTDAGGTDAGGTDAGGSAGDGSGGTDAGGAAGETSGNTGGNDTSGMVGGSGGSAGDSSGGSAGTGATGTGATGGNGGNSTDGSCVTAVVPERPDAEDTDALPRNLDAAGLPQQVDDASGEELILEIQDGLDPNDVIVLFAPPGTTEWTALPLLAGDAVMVEADRPGTYAPVVVDTSPPEGCTEAVWYGNVTLSSDADVRQLEGYTRVEGSLQLTGSVSDLGPLHCLTEVTEDLSLLRTNDLRAAAFENLVRVGGALSVMYGRVTTLTASRLRLAGTIYLEWIPSLAVNLDALLYLTRSGFVDEEPCHDDYGYEYCYDPPPEPVVSLTLREVSVTTARDRDLDLNLGRLVQTRGAIDVHAVEGLRSLDGLSALRKVDGYLDLSPVPELDTLAGLCALESVGLFLSIGGGPLEVISLPSLTDVGRELHTIRDRNIAISLGSLPNLVTLEMRSLEEIHGETRIYSVGADQVAPFTMVFDAVPHFPYLQLSDVFNLVDLEAFSAYRTFGAISIRDTDRLADTIGLSNIETAERIHISDTSRLTTISLGSLTDAGILEFDTMTQLTTVVLSSLERAQEIILRRLTTSQSSHLSLDFTKLRVVSEQLTIENCEDLTSVDAFSALTEVGQHLKVSDNPALVSLAGFDALVTLDGDLTVSGNTALSECLAAELLARLRTEGFDGVADISGNTPDTCN